MKNTFFIICIILLSVAPVHAERSEDDWKQIAVELYPALGIQGSALNALFLTRYRELQDSDPAYFRDSKWPALLARECSDALLHPNSQQQPIPQAEPTKTPAEPSIPPPPETAAATVPTEPAPELAPPSQTATQPTEDKPAQTATAPPLASPSLATDDGGSYVFAWLVIAAVVALVVFFARSTSISPPAVTPPLALPPPATKELSTSTSAESLAPAAERPHQKSDSQSRTEPKKSGWLSKTLTIFGFALSASIAKECHRQSTQNQPTYPYYYEPSGSAQTPASPYVPPIRSRTSLGDDINPPRISLPALPPTYTERVGARRTTIQNDLNLLDSYTVRPRLGGRAVIENDFNPLDSYTVKPRLGGGAVIEHDFNPMKSYTVRPRAFGGATIENDLNPLDSYTVRPRPGGGYQIENDFNPLDTIDVRRR